MYLSRAGLVVPDNSVSQSVLNTFKGKFTVTTKIINNIYKTIKSYQTVTGATVFAKMHALKLLSKSDIRVNINPGDKIIKNMDYSVTLTEPQKAVVKKLLDTYTYDNIEAGLGSCVMSLKPGRGKTYVSLSLVKIFARKTLVIVHTRGNINQWIRSAQAMYPELSISEWGKDPKADITVACYKSVTVTQDIDLLKTFGFTIFDEVPEYCTNTGVILFMRACSLITLAMTGTPDKRTDGMDKIAYHFVGSVVDCNQVYLDTENKGSDTKKVEWKSEVTHVRYNGPPEFTERIMSKMGTTCHPLMVNQYSADYYRTRLIIDLAIELYKLGHTTFIFLDRRKAATELAKTLAKLLGSERVITEEYIGGATNEQIERAKNDARICCVSYGCGGVGLSFSRYDSIIFAHPRKTGFDQFIARIYRLDSDISKIRRIVFIQDNQTSTKSHYYSFKKEMTIEHPEAKFITVVKNWSDIKIEI